jgi:hypothetical protein
MWSTFLEDPKSFKNKILSFYVEGETTNRPQDLFPVLPEWLDTKDYELNYRPNQKLLIFFTNSKTPFLTNEAPVVFEVITMESYYQDKKLKGKIMNIFRILQVWVPDAYDNKWINLKEKDLYAERGPVVGSFQIQVADLSLMNMMSQESPIWHEVLFREQHPIYVPITWTDIASFAARQSVKKYHGNDAMNEKLYMNIYTKVPGGSWQAINKKKVI